MSETAPVQVFQIGQRVQSIVDPCVGVFRVGAVRVDLAGMLWYGPDLMSCTRRERDLIRANPLPPYRPTQRAIVTRFETDDEMDARHVREKAIHDKKVEL